VKGNSNMDTEELKKYLDSDDIRKEFIIHPGETLKEILEDRGMSQKELALRTGVTEAHVSSIVNCQKAISVSYAKKLEYALGIDAGFWINLQANYDKELDDRLAKTAIVDPYG